MKNDINMKEFIEICKKYFNENDIKIIMEIGSLDGKDSLYFKKEYPNSVVYAIEGLYDNYIKYKEDLENINFVNIILCHYDGFIDYHKKNINGIHGIFDRGEEYGTETIKNSPCLTFKTFCLYNNIINVDLIKIDVEGATYEVLLGMGEMLNDVKILHIETESYDFFKKQKLHEDVCEYLIKHNFSLIELSSVDIIEDKKQYDSVWINNKFLKNK